MPAPARTVRRTVADKPAAYRWEVGLGRIDPAGVDVGSIDGAPAWLPYPGGVVVGAKQIPRGLTTTNTEVNQLGGGGIYTEQPNLSALRALQGPASGADAAQPRGPWYIAWAAFARDAQGSLNADTLWADLADDAPTFGYRPNTRSSRWWDIFIPSTRKAIAATIDAAAVTMRAMEIEDTSNATVVWGTTGTAAPALWSGTSIDATGKVLSIAPPGARTTKRLWLTRESSDAASAPLPGLRGTIERRSEVYRGRDDAQVKPGWFMLVGEEWRLVNSVSRQPDGYMTMGVG